MTALLQHKFDVIGDIHGELHALNALGEKLGYDTDAGWNHPEYRLPVFLGDLVDRGPHSLEVASLVQSLVEGKRAVCIMGNHEYNLVAWHLGVPGYEEPKSSNTNTIAKIEGAPERWAPVLQFFKTLPIGIELPDLRIIHACWHVPSLDRVRALLTPEAMPDSDSESTFDYIVRHVTLKSPFNESGLIEALPGDPSDFDDDLPHEILMKGFEVDAPKPFRDNYGKVRTRTRATWWMDNRDLVLDDMPQVFGHYWNVPPIEGHFAPPFPSGHPKLREWARASAAKCASSGNVQMIGDVACVDFNGLTEASDSLSCVGALRWPERKIVWATEQGEL